MRARIVSEFSACLLITWWATMASMMAFISSSLRSGELVNCSLVFAAAWLRHRGLGWAADLLPPPEEEIEP